MYYFPVDSISAIHIVVLSICYEIINIFDISAEIICKWIILQKVDKIMSLGLKIFTLDQNENVYIKLSFEIRHAE